jgi:hypothetical protein
MVKPTLKKDRFFVYGECFEKGGELRKKANKKAVAATTAQTARGKLQLSHLTTLPISIIPQILKHLRAAKMEYKDANADKTDVKKRADNTGEIPII